MRASHRVDAVFDDPNLVSAAGLVPVLRLGEAAGLHELLDEHLSVASPNPVVKSASVIAGMLAGADSIDDLDVLRHGGMRRCFAGVRAPSRSRCLSPDPPMILGCWRAGERESPCVAGESGLLKS